MSDFPTHDDLVEIGIQTILTTPGSKLTEEAARREGSDLNIVLNVAAAMGEEISRQGGIVAAGLMLDTAEGEALDRLVFDLPFPVERQPATPAMVTAKFLRPNVLKGPGTIPAKYRFKLGGFGFQALYDTPVAAGVLQVLIDAQAEKTGAEGNVPITTPGTLADSLWDTSFVVTANETGAGGQTAESDESLRARARKAHETARRGTLAAIEFGAMTIPGIAHATAYEVQNANGQLAQAVELIIADRDGNANTALQNAVAAILDEYRPAGIPVTLTSGTPVLEDVILQMTFLAGIDTQAAFQAAADRIVAEVNTLSAGQSLLVADLIEAAKRGGTAQTGIVECKVIEPAGNVVPSTNNQVIRTSKALVSLQP